MFLITRGAGADAALALAKISLGRIRHCCSAAKAKGTGDRVIYHSTESVRTRICLGVTPSRLPLNRNDETIEKSAPLVPSRPYARLFSD